MSDIASKVKAVNELLLAGEPANISVDEHSGYTGYKPQALIDAMNAVFAYGEWGFEEISNEIAGLDKPSLAVAQVKVFLKGVDCRPSGWGQNRITRGDIGDARKGAQTDAIKKALSYFSIGNRAYLGLLPNKEEQAKNARSNGGVAARPTPPAPVQKPAQPSPVPPQSTTREPEPTQLNAIPVKSALKQSIETGKYVDASGKPLDWRGFVAIAFKSQLDQKKFTLDKVIEAEWTPNYCQHAASVLAKLKKAEAA